MELSVVAEVIGLASGAAGATGKAAETIKTIAGLFNNGKEPDTDEAARLLNVLAAELTSANMMNVQLSNALKILSQELHKEDTFQTDKARYELWHTNEDDLVFKLKEDVHSERPLHFICPVCLNRDKLISFITGSGDFKTCQTNSSHLYRFGNTPMRAHRRNGFV